MRMRPAGAPVAAARRRRGRGAARPRRAQGAPDGRAVWTQKRPDDRLGPGRGSPRTAPKRRSRGPRRGPPWARGRPRPPPRGNDRPPGAGAAPAPQAPAAGARGPPSGGLHAPGAPRWASARGRGPGLPPRSHRGTAPPRRRGRRAPGPDGSDRSRGALGLEGGPTAHPSRRRVRTRGRPRGPAGGSARCPGAGRPPPGAGPAGGLAPSPDAAPPLGRPAPTPVVVAPSRARGRHGGASGVAASPRHCRCRGTSPPLGVHRGLSRNDGPTLSMDLSGASPHRVNCGEIAATL